MTKPICKSEAKWKYWRKNAPWETDKFMKWQKRKMIRARRRFKEDHNDEDTNDFN